MPDPTPKYEGPYESQEEEDLAYKRYQKLRARARAEKDEAEKKDKDEKRKKLLPVVE